MAEPEDQDSPVAPRSAIRRFDVFAEYSRQERLEKGYSEAEARGYGIWLAKVVAARRFGAGTAAGERARSKQTGTEQASDEPRFRSVGDELQTDETFDHDIIDRMGGAFYHEVFKPAITAARAQGHRYEAIRDTIRKEWKPARRKGP